MGKAGFQWRLLVLVVALTMLPALPAEPPESPVFSETADLSEHPVAWFEAQFTMSSGENFGAMLTYPAEEGGGGEHGNMSQVGTPFPFLIFFGDDGEDVDNYDWIGQVTASAGYVVCIPEDRWDTDEPALLLNETFGMMSAFANINQTGMDNDFPSGFTGAFDLDHWGVAGHGEGATLAATVQLAWDAWVANDTFSPPRALFGLGLDKADMPSVSSLMPHIPDPGLALFLTGTVDDLAPANTNVNPLLEDWPRGWHLMEPLGANHLQYQDDTAILEGWNDGTATMSKSEQQSHAIDHVIPYLDLVLKGDNGTWIAATNREQSTEFPSDADAYVSEHLGGVRMLHVADPSMPASPVDKGEIANFSMVMMHRDGGPISPFASGLVISCEVLGQDLGLFNGSLDQFTSRGSCDVNLDDLSPGPYTVEMKVSLDGMPASITMLVQRNNTGLVLTEPTPAITLLQHGSVNVSADIFATDPDGQEVVVVNATISGVEGLEIGVAWNGPTLTVAHIGEPEWNGSALMSLQLTESNTSGAEVVNLTVLTTVLPVDDPVIEIAQIPRLDWDEDSGWFSYDVSPYFQDPEGEDLVLTAETSDVAVSALIEGHNLSLSADEDWNGAAILTIEVGDGVNPPISQDIPLVVNPIPDDPRHNASAWNISMVEDEVTEILLTTLAWDPDGIELNYTFSPDAGVETWGILIENSILAIEPPSNYFGQIELGWLNATDGDANISERLIITVEAVADAPQVSWLGELWEDDILVISYSFFDEDGDVSHEVSYSLEGGVWVTIPSECTGGPTEFQQCEVKYNSTGLPLGSYSLDLSIIAPPHSSAVERVDFELDSQKEEGEATDTLSAIVDNPYAWGVLAGLLLLPLVVRLLKTGRDDRLSEAIAAEEKEVTVIPDEETAPQKAEGSAASGLLARAEKLNK